VINAKNRKAIVFSSPEEYAYPKKLEVKLEKEHEEIGEEASLEEVVKTEDRTLDH
jgi:predicted house-cleaning noncanonical NTP pyrophosphatase (MazG superfamily)